MSLSFVSSAVLTSTDGVSHNEEKELESKELEAVRRVNKNNGNKSLFEQLRTNQEEDAEREAEERRTSMRGTLALDSEDVAHLDSLERSKLETEEKIRTQVNQELALFRAAKEERRTGQLLVADEDQQQKTLLGTTNKQPNNPQTTKRKPSLLVPKIVGKRKRNNDTTSNYGIKNDKKNEIPHDKKNASITTIVENLENATSFGGLLGDYGSSSDEEN
mmetsp:Transcript_38354/g.43791  ORF Transcript_38354/g.43791 Transcript_38354/m.43791 type:complete len:218 (-) Transcript_38354:68-721(-)